MHKNAMKCNEILSKWCKNKHGASKIMNTFETYHRGLTKIEQGQSYVTEAAKLGSSDLCSVILIVYTPDAAFASLIIDRMPSLFAPPSIEPMLRPVPPTLGMTAPLQIGRLKKK
jgi:hypothetical protein